MAKTASNVCVRPCVCACVCACVCVVCVRSCILNQCALLSLLAKTCKGGFEVTLSYAINRRRNIMHLSDLLVAQLYSNVRP